MTNSTRAVREPPLHEVQHHVSSRRGGSRTALCACLLAIIACGEPQENANPIINPYATTVIRFTPGTGAGYGQTEMPRIVLGAPLGRDQDSGGFNVVSLGDLGEIVLGFDVEIINGPGIDFIVFENPFLSGTSTWYELGSVAVSDDGLRWFDFPCDPQMQGPPFPQCAGWQPVSSSAGEPLVDPNTDGGDGFDLADLEGLPDNFRGRYIKIRDLDVAFDKSLRGPENHGFDLDAVGIVVR